MAIELTEAEIVILDKADNDLTKFGETEEKCPRFGNEIVIEKFGKSYSVKCKTHGCIYLNYRGV